MTLHQLLALLGHLNFYLQNDNSSEKCSSHPFYLFFFYQRQRLCFIIDWKDIFLFSPTKDRSRVLSLTGKISLLIYNEISCRIQALSILGSSSVLGNRYNTNSPKIGLFISSYTATLHLPFNNEFYRITLKNPSDKNFPFRFLGSAVIIKYVE